MPKDFSPQELSAEALNLIAARFKALSEPNRLRLLIALQSGRRSVNELVRSTGMGQANVSRHLKTLTEAGLLVRQQAGAAVYYAIADPRIFQMCRQVCGGIRRHLDLRVKAFQV